MLLERVATVEGLHSTTSKLGKKYSPNERGMEGSRATRINLKNHMVVEIREDSEHQGLTGKMTEWQPT